MSVLISPSVLLIFIWFPLTELGEVCSGCWGLKKCWSGAAHRNLGRLIDLKATEQNNWVVPDRHPAMKCNTVTALVLTASEGDTECYAKNISVEIFGLHGPVDSELRSSRAKKKNLNAVSSCLLLQIVVYFPLWCTESYKACFKSV